MAIGTVQGQQARETRQLFQKYALFLVAYGCIYAALFEAANLIVGFAGYSLWFPAAGVRLAALLFFGWPYVFLIIPAEILAQVSLGWLGVWGIENLHWMLPGIAISPIIYAAVIWLVRKAKLDIGIDNFYQVLGFIGVATIAPGIAAPFSVFFQCLAGLIGWTDFAGATFSFWIGDAIGALMLAPALLLAANHFTGKEHPVSVGRSFAIESVIVVSAGFGVLALTGMTTEVFRWYFAFIPLLWLSLRYGIYGAIVAVILINFTSAGVESLEPATNARFELQLFLVILSAVGLIVGALVSAREEATRQLLKQTQHLARMDRVSSLNAMATNLAHEMAQPLAAVSSYVQTALSTPQKQSELENTVQKIGEETNRLVQVTDRIKALSQDRPSRQETFDLVQAVHDVLPLVQGEARRAGIEISVSTEVVPLPACADPVQTQQVVLNLVRNSIEALKAVSGAEKSIALYIGANPDSNLSVTVEDTGPGIPAGAYDALFEPFHSTKPDGIGMGLAISKSIVENQGGEIFADAPKNGAGLRVTFTVPAARRSNESAHTGSYRG